MWAYEEYSEWSRLLAQSSASDMELTRRLAKAEKATAKSKESHFMAIRRTSSMQGQSARRASTRTSMVASYEEENALRDALELRRLFPMQALSTGGVEGTGRKLLDEFLTEAERAGVTHLRIEEAVTPPQAPSSAIRDAAYDQIDRFLRNNLSDEDYADYSQALDLIAIDGVKEDGNA